MSILEGRVAVVTGASSGIGEACALAFVEKGAKVVLAARRAERLDKLVKRIEGMGREALAVMTDVTREADVDNLFERALERFGTIDVLVANAGGQFAAPAEEISGKGWRAVERLNLEANWDLTSRVATESMIPSRGGLIVFVGFSPRRGIPTFAHACATRAALENLASSLALEWSRYGIRSVCLSCGPIETEGLASYGPDSLEESRRTVPLGRLGTAGEVGETVAFLASPGGAFITGTTILVDGGVDAWGLAEPPPVPER